MYRSIISLIILFAPFYLQAQANLQPKQSSMQWTGKAAFNSYSLSGTLEPKSCDLQLTEGQIQGAQLIVDMRSLHADIKDLKTHLRSKDFFEVNAYPEASFMLTQAIPFSNGTHQLVGELKIKGQSHPISFDATIDRQEGSWYLRGICVVDRTKYGIYFNSPSFFENLKEQAIADEFELAFELVFGE